MSNSQPAGGRVLQNLVGSLSSGTQTMLSNSHLVTPQNTSDTVPQQPVTQSGGLLDDSLLSDAAPAQPVAAVQPAPEPPVPPTQSDDLTDESKLAIFEDVLNEVENLEPEVLQANMQSVLQGDPTIPAVDPSVLDQAVPLAVTQQQQAPQPQGGGRQKETFEGFGGSTVATTELPGGMQYVEQEKSPELPPEVESYIEHVEAAVQDDQQMVVVAEDVPAEATSPAAPPRIVRVLPISKAQEEVGMKKNPTFSVRWLVEFGHKLAKMFVGQVIYRE